MVAVPPWVRNRSPHRPEVSAVSVVVIIHPEGSHPDAAHTFAVSVEPATRK
jgi:hypothetical protein